MKILGIDTSTRFLCIGIYDGKNIYEYRLDLGRGHDIFLLEHINRIIGILKIKIKEIDYLAAGLGPGSFTGLRIGLATIKGLSFIPNKRLIGISTLDIIAYNALDIRNASYICPLLDARRGLVYGSLYKKNNSSFKRVLPYRLIRIEDLIKKIPKGTVFLGEAVNIYKSLLISKVKDCVILDEEYFWPRGTNIINLAIEHIKRRDFICRNQLKPLYLYPKECQVRACASKGGL